MNPSFRTKKNNNNDNQGFLQRVMSLYTSAHYKNQPNDLQMLSDAPAHHLFVLLGPKAMEQGEKGNLPDVLVVVQVYFLFFSVFFFFRIVVVQVCTVFFFFRLINWSFFSFSKRRQCVITSFLSRRGSRVDYCSNKHKYSVRVDLFIFSTSIKCYIAADFVFRIPRPRCSALVLAAPDDVLVVVQVYFFFFLCYYFFFHPLIPPPPDAPLWCKRHRMTLSSS